MSSTGMKVMCSIMSGQLRSLSSSPCRALQGNQLIVPPSYKSWSAEFVTSTTFDETIWYNKSLPGNTPYQLYVDLYNYCVASGWTNNYTSQYSSLYAGVSSWSTSATIVSTPSFSIGNGWNWAGGIYQGGGYIYEGMAKNTTGITQPYFIGRLQTFFTATNGTNPYNGLPYVVGGVTATQAIVSIDSTGLILPNQVIGIGGDINLPISPYTPMSLFESGNALLAQDVYFPVIGMDPISFATLESTAFGTHTYSTGGNNTQPNLTFNPNSAMNRGFQF